CGEGRRRADRRGQNRCRVRALSGSPSTVSLSTVQVACDAGGHPLLEVGRWLVPLEAAVTPQPSILPSREGVSAVAYALDRLGQGKIAPQRLDQLAVAGRREARQGR